MCAISCAMCVKNALFLVKNSLQSIKILHTEDAKKPCKSEESRNTGLCALARIERFEQSHIFAYCAIYRDLFFVVCNSMCNNL